MKGMNETKGDDGVRGKRRRIGGDLIAEFPVVMSTVDHPLLFSSLPVLSLALLSSLSINLAKSQDRILFPSRIGEYFHSKYILYPLLLFLFPLLLFPPVSFLRKEREEEEEGKREREERIDLSLTR